MLLESNNVTLTPMFVLFFGWSPAVVFRAAILWLQHPTYQSFPVSTSNSYFPWTNIALATSRERMESLNQG